MATAKRSRLEDVLTRHQVMVQRLSTGHADKFGPFLRRVRSSLRERLSEEAELTTFRRERLEKLLAAVDRAVASPFGDFANLLMADLREFAQHEAGFSARALQSEVHGFEAVLPGPNQVRAAVLASPLAASDSRGGKLLAEFIKDWTAAERKAVIGAIRLGVFEGQTNAEIIRRLTGTRAMQFADGILNVSARHAGAVVHTAVQHVSSVARQLTFNQNADLIKAVRWISTLDNRTCSRCAGLDRRVFPLDKGPRAPLHVRCRCTMIAVLDDEYSALSRGGTRASAGAAGGRQVPAGVTYYEWLMQQPPGFQDVAIGPARAKLLREGGLSPTRFAQLQLDRNFAAITLEQMRRLEPLAFERAGL